MTARDWQAEIDLWTERFRTVDDPPEPFATAIREGWSEEARARLAAEAEAYLSAHTALTDHLAGSGIDLVRLDCNAGSCGLCAKYCGSAYSLTGETEGLPAPPPLPVCPACRHTLNMVTPFFMQSLGLEIEDLVAAAQPFVD